MRLKKSGIEYVILAGSVTFWPNLALPHGMSVGSVSGSLRRAQRAIFSRILTFWDPNPENFAGPQGHAAHELGHSSLMIGISIGY